MYTDNLIVKWEGPRTIKGIIAVRTVFGLGLKQAINLLKDPEGFVISPVQWIALRGEYMLKRGSFEERGMLKHGSFEDREVKDWLVETYKTTNPTWLVDHICRDPLTS